MVAFLRALAVRAEADGALAAQIAAALRESGLLPGDEVAVARATAAEQAGGRKRGAGASTVKGLEAPDPFVVLRERGEAGLRAALDALDLPALRQIVRAHRLDPARISARWTARDRVIALIVDQVRARADHGKAFARV
ncbi:MAG: hypothetical protein ACRDHP_10465 [Ktedonobacterales bacterium]